MADNPKVKGIKYGTMQQYLRQEIDNDMLYFITDKGLLYRGSQIVVPTKVIDVEPNEDVHNNAYYTFTIEAYADDPANPETLSFDVWSKAAVTTLIQSLSTAISNHTGATASDTVKGHTYLSDATDSDLNAATGGTAATPLAVKRALAAANQYTDEQIANISSGMTIIGTYGLQADNPDEYRSLNDIPASKGDTYICISTMTGVAYTNSAGIAVNNASLAPGDYIICVQAAVESGGTITTPARWTIVSNTASNAVTTNDTLTADNVILGNGNKTVKKLAAGTNGQFLRQTPNGARWRDHVNLDHGIAYAECESLLDEHNKVVEINNYVPQNYSIVAVRFAQGVGEGDELSIIDGEAMPVERVPIIYHGEIINKGVIYKGDTVTFMYVPDFLIKDQEIRAWVIISIDRAPNNTPTSLSAFTNDIQGLGTCSTGYGTQQKQVTMSGVTINKGSVFAVRFSNPVGAGATMKVNQQAVKAIKHRNLDITTGQILGGDTAIFISDGSYYHLLAVDRPIDTAPTAGSHNMVESNGIYNMIQSAIAESTLYWEEMQ
ncbi:MAG: phage tail protein [Bacteroidales bacterium]|nr:phage tail protein [Bacteroidales bacterium]